MAEDMEAFKAAGTGLCAVCGAGRRIKAHHVVYQQHVRDVNPDALWDTRNALPVCERCHQRHHNAFVRIPKRVLTEANLEFMEELLGLAADDYLARRYR